MKWNKHLNLEGKHALFSPSQPRWVKYNDEQILQFLKTQKAAAEGTRLHEWAAECIRLGKKQIVPRGKVRTIESYINDAIGYGMDPEVMLHYNDLCFGTADSICFRNGKLRIHDLKTGTGRVHPEQLVVYAALFCLEYRENPEDMKEIVLQIYQNDMITKIEVEPEDIRDVMDHIKHVTDKIVDNM